MQRTLDEWLAKRVARQRRSNFIVASVGVLLGSWIAFLTFWFVYALVWFIAMGLPSISEMVFDKRLYLARPWRYAVAGSFMLLVCINAVRSQSTDTDSRPTPRYLTPLWMAGIGGALVQLLRNPQASSTMIVDLLQIGPRIILGSFALVRETRTMQVDWQQCVPVIRFLMPRSNAASWDELSEAFPASDWNYMCGQLRCVTEIVFLEKGMSLSESFREDLHKACQVEQLA